ncbi:MAG: class I SAM-dependent methyltransferase [Stellaceae bacterium]
MSIKAAEDALKSDLQRFVSDEAFLWGDNATQIYFEPAEKDFEKQWAMVQQFLSSHRIDYTNTLELSCGHGRNSERLASLAQNMTLIDVNPENVQFCKQRFSGKSWQFIVNNGFDLADLPDSLTTFIYWFEAAVHIDLEIIISYIKEFRRILAPGGLCFVHHSNVSDQPGADFRDHPGWRNFMSKEIFAHLCIHNGLDIVKQHIFHQGGPEADCFSLVQKPYSARERAALSWPITRASGTRRESASIANSPPVELQIGGAILRFPETTNLGVLRELINLLKTMA